METETIYTCEILQQGVIVELVKRKTPFPRYEIGMQVMVEGAEPRSYTVRTNCVGVDDRERQYPLRQTLIVD